MFKTIVVGIDGRQGGQDALALAASLQRVFAGDLVAVHAFALDYYRGRGADGEHEEVLHDRAQGSPGRRSSAPAYRPGPSWSPMARPAAPCTVPRLTVTPT